MVQLNPIAQEPLNWRSWSTLGSGLFASRTGSLRYRSSWFTSRLFTGVSIQARLVRSIIWLALEPGWGITKRPVQGTPSLSFLSPCRENTFDPLLLVDSVAGGCFEEHGRRVIERRGQNMEERVQRIDVTKDNV